MSVEDRRSLEEIKQDIVKARKWARLHFNVDQEEDHLLAKPTFDMEYPEPDKITVWARSYGKRLWPPFTYTLIWIGDSLIWRGEHPFHGTVIDLKVSE